MKRSQLSMAARTYLGAVKALRAFRRTGDREWRLIAIKLLTTLV